MSFLQKLIETGCGKLSEEISSALVEAGRKDKITRHLITQLSKEESSLIEMVKLAGKQVRQNAN